MSRNFFTIVFFTFIILIIIKKKIVVRYLTTNSKSVDHIYPNCAIENHDNIYSFGLEIYMTAVNMTLNIQYFFNDHDIWSVGIAGTLLGAIRHQTQIPWDNDIDFAIKLKDVPKLLSLNEELISKGYRLYSIYRLVKIRAITIVPCTNEIIYLANNNTMDLLSSAGGGYHYFKKKNNNTVCMKDIAGTWLDVFVISHICANLYIDNTGDYFNPLVRCRCYMFDNISSISIEYGLNHHRNNTVQGVHNHHKSKDQSLNRGNDVGIPMPNICGEIDKITGKAVEYYPERKLYKFDKGLIWGQKDYKTVLTLKYGENWIYFIGNVGKHLSIGNHTACRYYDLEKNITINKLI
jgi:hypothetical protein